MKLERSTKRLVIRAYKKSDYKAWRLAQLALPEKKQKFWYTLRPSENELTKEKFAAYLFKQNELYKSDKFYNFGVFLKDGTVIGNVSIMDVSRSVFQNAYIGYSIFSSYWGQGFGKESVSAMIDMAFKDLKLHRIEAGIEPKNIKSVALAKSLGLKREGLSKKRIYINEDWRDLVLYAATCEDFGIAWKYKK